MANKRIQDLPALTPATTLILPVTNGSTTGRVTISEVCGVITSGQISSALGYTPVGTTSQAVAKAWVYFDPRRNTSGTVSITNTPRLIRASYNVSDVTRTGEGLYTVTFTPMVDTNYVVHLTVRNNNDSAGPAYEATTPARTTSSVGIVAGTLSNSGGVDPYAYSVTIFR